ncbi:MAG: hypothetical protein D6711_04740 [Chloroflexi bacterium]|nr:MAG: hypothetical protein D6711_04740 [Chloroflexota bacterium]
MSDLPEFDKHVPFHKANSFAIQIFGDKFVNLHAHDDGHYRVVFKKSFFTLTQDNTEPTKSQWNTLKKRMKRINKRVFIFKEHGETSEDHYYMDFGFFAY